MALFPDDICSKAPTIADHNQAYHYCGNHFTWPEKGLKLWTHLLMSRGQALLPLPFWSLQVNFTTKLLQRLLVDANTRQSIQFAPNTNPCDKLTICWLSIFSPLFCSSLSIARPPMTKQCSTICWPVTAKWDDIDENRTKHEVKKNNNTTTLNNFNIYSTQLQKKGFIFHVNHSFSSFFFFFANTKFSQESWQVHSEVSFTAWLVDPSF